MQRQQARGLASGSLGGAGNELLLFAGSGLLLCCWWAVQLQMHACVQALAWASLSLSSVSRIRLCGSLLDACCPVSHQQAWRWACWYVSLVYLMACLCGCTQLWLILVLGIRAVGVP
jgi:hypothetical protein